MKIKKQDFNVIKNDSQPIAWKIDEKQRLLVASRVYVTVYKNEKIENDATNSKYAFLVLQTDPVFR